MRAADAAPGLGLVTPEGGRSGAGVVVELGRARSAANHRWGQFQLVTKRQFAEIEGVSTKTVERWMHAGLPFEKRGERRNSRVYVPLVAGQAWVRQHA